MSMQAVSKPVSRRQPRSLVLPAKPPIVPPPVLSAALWQGNLKPVSRRQPRVGLLPGRTVQAAVTRPPLRILSARRTAPPPFAGAIRIGSLPRAVDITPIHQGSYPRITCTFDGDAFFRVGQNGPLRWVFSRPDGEDLDLPTSATVTVTPPIGDDVEITPEVEADGAAMEQVLSCLCPMSTRGIYSLLIEAQFGDVIAGGRVTIVCDN